MNVLFDAFNQPEKPNIILCNPNKEPIYALGGIAFNIAPKLVFNGMSTLTFTFPASIDANVTHIEAYDYIQTKRLIYIDSLQMYFVITQAEEDLDGSVDKKLVTCQSLEAEMVYKVMLAFGGTLEFWNPVTPASSLLGQIIEFVPNWSVGYVDPDIQTVYRTFNITSSKTIYDFLLNDVETAYQCVFVFDAMNRKINAYSTANAPIPTDIFLSFDNLLRSGKLTELTDELVTGLHVSGDSGVDIHQVNPLGTDEIYNFDYFKTLDWMSQDLIDAITAWENNLVIQQPIYANYLTQLSDINADLLTQQATLSNQNIAMSSLIDVQQARIQSGISYSDITAEMNALQPLINTTQSIINDDQNQITEITNNLTTISNELQFSNAFTSDQLKRLSPFIIENTYQNKNFVTTDTMTADQIQSEIQELYDQATAVLATVSQPRYEITIDSANFMVLPQFKPFIDQLQLGAVINVDKGNGTILNIVLLELDFQIDDMTKFTVTMSNDVRLNKKKFIYADLFQQAISAGTSVSFNATEWSNWTQYKDDVTTFIDSALNASNNAIISSNNENIIIDEHGLRGRQYNPITQTFSPQQVWLVNNMLAFTKDGWNTSSLALGAINVNGNTTYGIIADAICGNMIIGNTLNIENSSNTFSVNANGATLTNATLSIIGNNGKNKILLDPINGLTIETLISGSYVNEFYVDSLGNVNFAGVLNGASGNFSGSLTAATGTIGGWTISPTGLADTHGNYIYSSGNFKLGPLTVSGSTGTFSGNFYASNLVGQITGGQVANNTISDGNISSGLNAGKITYGSMSGNQIYGGTAALSGISAVSGNLHVAGSVIASDIVQASNFSTSGGAGQSVTLTVSTPYGNMNLYFSAGLMCGYNYV